MSPQRYWQKGVDVFDQLISQLKAAFQSYYHPATPPADAEQAAVQARGILAEAAQEIKDTLHQTEHKVDAVLDASAGKIALKLAALPQPVPCDVGPTEFHTTPPAEGKASAYAECAGDEQSGTCTLPGLHPGGMAAEAHP